MPLDLTIDQVRGLIGRRHEEWDRHQTGWRWMMDSYEGGDRYRNAVYGLDQMGLPDRNLTRHKREYPSPQEINAAGGYGGYANSGAGYGGNGFGGAADVDSGLYAGVDDYELRRARTPTPSMVAEGIETHLAKIYSKEVRRDGPKTLADWWKDVDGRGTPADDWFAQDVAPVFLALGQLDIMCDRPPAPEGEAVESRADERRLNLGRAVASYALPENVLWWRLKPDGSYAEILLLEYDEGAEPDPDEQKAQGLDKPGNHPYAMPPRALDHRDRFRYWSEDFWFVASCRGTILASGENPYGEVPVRRVFFRRKVRERNVGHSFYEAAAILQREYYNRDSELILSDTIQAFPLLQGPEDYVKEDGSIPIGPGWLLPKKKNTQGGSATYEGFEVVDFPKGGAESIRKNKDDLRDQADRSMRLTKPSGSAGTGNNPVAQSGLSKAIDNDAVYASYARHAAALGRLEMAFARLALLVIHAGDRAKVDADLAATDLVYPSEFDLDDADDMAKGLADFQTLLAEAGKAPVTETLWLQRIARRRLAGQSPQVYEEIEAEIAEVIEAKAKALSDQAEAGTLSPMSLPAAERAATPDAGAGSDEGGTEDQPAMMPQQNPFPMQTGA